ncbi:META domain-containing protein [Pedobacter sp. SYP-B3415]|uniref:META domain-containing protein n=1 Tax=Pedobacter sp. SYP-B3415 TaxID=2496641 RepID=UPI00101BCC04|nr:META domain-containing protein [Pedobacter sp. SYP-B3415]
MKKYAFALILLCFFGSCLEKADLASLNGTKWELTELPGKTLPTSGKGTLNIDGDKVGGKAFCNGFGGNVVVTGNKVRIEKIISTKMFCEELSTFENAYIRALEATNTVKKDGEKLVLLNGDQTLLVFSKAE